MFRPLRYIFDRIITTGHLNLIDADGHNYGFGDHSGVPVIARIADNRTDRLIALNPMLAVGEGLHGRPPHHRAGHDLRLPRGHPRQSRPDSLAALVPAP